MTLKQTIKALCAIADEQPNIRTCLEGSIYENLNANPSVKYDCFIVTQQKHRQTESYDNYHFILFYVSRLQDNLEQNRIQCQSIGKEVLGNIIRSFVETYDLDYPTVEYTVFTQRFADLCCGCFADVTLAIPVDTVCAEYYEDMED